MHKRQAVVEAIVGKDLGDAPVRLGRWIGQRVTGAACEVND
jgi:hypothetical protein